MKTVRLAALALGCSLAAPLGAAESQPPYLDNRSDAAELVRSLYNAINRREYARAWSYFGEKKPAQDLPTFTEGYAQTGRVEIETGDITQEGAAGSVFYSVPVAIKAIDKDGSEKVFAGCYTARLSDPQIQDASFTPMHIESGVLKPAKGGLAEALPATCGGDPAPVKDVLLEAVKKRFAADYSGHCQTLEPGAEAGAADPTTYAIAFHRKSETEADPEHEAKLFRFRCGQGAYNTTEVYYQADDAGEPHRLQFAVPDLEIHYENNNSERTVESIGIVGYTAMEQLVNSEYSPETASIDSISKWRGAGDASAVGRWIFRDGNFTLVKYEVDAAYDGEVNYETVLDFDTAP